jgi:hypothetical protein
VQDLAATLERSAEHDEALVDQGIHEARMLLPAVLLTQIPRPIPWAAALQMNGEEHGENCKSTTQRICRLDDIRQRSPALAGSIGAGRRWTVSMISLLSIPWR